MLGRSSPCTKLHKDEQKDRTKTLAEFPDHILNDYGETRFIRAKIKHTPLL